MAELSERIELLYTLIEVRMNILKTVNTDENKIINVKKQCNLPNE